MSNDPWKQRSSEMRCKTCIWFIKKDDSADNEIGHCRRHAPTMNGYPVVWDSDWCGDYESDENKI